MSGQSDDSSDDEFFDADEYIDQAAEPTESQREMEARFLAEAQRVEEQLAAMRDEEKSQPATQADLLALEGRLAKMQAPPGEEEEKKEVMGEENQKEPTKPENQLPDATQALLDSTTELLELPDTSVFMISSGSKKLFAHGTLSVRLRTHPGRDAESYLLLLNEFRYTIDRLVKVACMRAAPGNYVVSGGAGKLFYGLTLSAGASEADVSFLESVLVDNTQFSHAHVDKQGGVVVSKGADDAGAALASEEKVLEHLNESRTSRYIRQASAKVTVASTVGSRKLASGIVKGSSLLSGAIGKGRSKVKSKMRPRAQSIKLSASTKQRIEKAREASTAARRTTTSVLESVHKHVKTAGSHVAERAVETNAGQKVKAKVQQRRQKPEGASTKAAKQAVSSVISGALVVAGALDDASETLLLDLTSATADVVSHKYGEEAGKATQDSLGIGTDLYLTTKQIRDLGVKSVARKAAVVTASSLAREVQGNKEKARIISEPEIGEEDHVLADAKSSYGS